MTESKSLVDGYLWIQKWSACRSKLCYLSERQRFPLMVFCSYNIFLKIATSFSMVALVDSPVRVCTWRLLKKVLSGHGLTCEVLSYFHEGSFHYRLELGYLFLNLLPTHPRKVPGIHKVFCYQEFPLRWKVLFYRPLLDASLLKLKKKRNSSFKNCLHTL